MPQLNQSFDAGVTASQTDHSIAAGIAKYRIRVFAAILTPGGANATQFTFNSKGAGAGTSISQTYTVPATGQPIVLPFNPNGWFETNAGEGLTCTTGSGDTLGVQVDAQARYVGG